MSAPKMAGIHAVTDLLKSVKGNSIKCFSWKTSWILHDSLAIIDDCTNKSYSEGLLWYRILIAIHIKKHF